MSASGVRGYRRCHSGVAVFDTGRLGRTVLPHAGDTAGAAGAASGLWLYAAHWRANQRGGSAQGGPHLQGAAQKMLEKLTEI